MEIVYAQLDEDGKVINVFGSPQDPDVWPGVIEMQDDDPRYIAFISPDPLIVANLALQELVRLAAAQKAALTERISQINDAVDYGDATAAELAELPQRVEQLAAWKRYATLLGRVTKQPGWYSVVDWPAQPAEGMDLSVSAVAPGSSQLQ